MYNLKKENIEKYEYKNKKTSRPSWGTQWDEDLMKYLDTNGPTSLFKKMLSEHAEEPCIVLGLASENETLVKF